MVTDVRSSANCWRMSLRLQKSRKRRCPAVSFRSGWFQQTLVYVRAFQRYLTSFSEKGASSKSTHMSTWTGRQRYSSKSCHASNVVGLVFGFGGSSFVFLGQWHECVEYGGCQTKPMAQISLLKVWSCQSPTLQPLWSPARTKFNPHQNPGLVVQKST